MMVRLPPELTVIFEPVPPVKVVAFAVKAPPTVIWARFWNISVSPTVKLRAPLSVIV